jgi:polyhydroxybutyrate depolymerase
MLCLAALLTVGIETRSIRVDQQTWNYHFVSAGGDRPLVLALHGGGGEGRGYLEKNHWREVAITERWNVVAPDALPARPGMAAEFRTNPRLWNSGQLRIGTPRGRIDDVKFVRQLLETLPWDGRNLFITGHSNGGSMTFRLARELNDRVTAIAPILTQYLGDSQTLSRPVPTLHFIGSVDPLIPVAGGERTTPWGKSSVKPQAEAIINWANANGHAGPARVISETRQVRKEAYGPSFQVWWLLGHGHGYPGGESSGLPASTMGPNTSPVDATREAARFFRGYVKA